MRTHMLRPGSVGKGVYSGTEDLPCRLGLETTHTQVNVTSFKKNKLKKKNTRMQQFNRRNNFCDELLNPGKQGTQEAEEGQGVPGQSAPYSAFDREGP